jgi:hypothetical protein
MARSRKTTITQLSRDAIIYYLDNYEQSLSGETEGNFAKQLRESTATTIEVLIKCTNRICGLLAKIAISSETTNQYIAATGNSKDLLNQSRGIAVKKISGGILADENETVTRMRNNVQRQ